MPIAHDGKIAISLGASRWEKSWQNKDVLWSDLIKKFATTHYTAETHASYLSQPLERQGEIKDIGGFVGGHILNGRRKNGACMYRSLITLDIDFCKGNIWDDYTMFFTEAAAVYTTHKHSPENPRYRLVIPLNRNVLADEYEAIARKVASVMDIEVFDATTFQPTRLMYWPSTSKDGVYYWNTQDGPFMNADSILKQYTDWTDSTQWPTCKKEIDAAKRGIKKQGDPSAKEGLIGAFCRTYNIHDAIEKFLSDVYEPTDYPDRYTYLHGSTSGGLVTYDDLYAFSHHGTDPASNNLCNAFDLVRVHKFGLSDENAETNTPTNKLPSYKLMMHFAGDDPLTKRAVVTEKFDQAQEDFIFMDIPAVPVTETVVTGDGKITEVVVPEDITWRDKLEVEKKGPAAGKLKQTIYNGALILEHDNRLNKCFGYDVFSQRKTINNNLPWRILDAANQYLKDEDEAALRLYLERAYGLTSRMAISDALDTHIFKRAFHPIRDYLDGLKWDGKPRVDKLLIKYMGADDSPYIRAVTRKTLVAAVRRIYLPGVKFDYILTMAGEEGKGKSTLIRKLGGTWFSDNFDTVEGNRAMEQLQGRWLIEMGELKAMKRAEVYSIKTFVSKQEDEFRPAYGHNKLYLPRQCVFFATTNEVEFLRGADGNRRFWIVDIHRGKAQADILDDNSIAAEERNQIWAEAKHYHLQGEKLFLDSSLEAVAKSEQTAHGEYDERTGIVQEYLDMKLPHDWPSMSARDRRAWIKDDANMKDAGVLDRDRACVSEIWVECLELNLKDLNPYAARTIHNIVKQIPGWEDSGKKLRFGAYGVQKAYIKSLLKENAC